MAGVRPQHRAPQPRRVNVPASGTLTVVNGTLCGNTSEGLGDAMSAVLTLTVINSTIDMHVRHTEAGMSAAGNE